MSIGSNVNTDYVTVLTVRWPQDKVMTKRLFRATNGVIGKKGYDNASHFNVQKIYIDNLVDLIDVLTDLARHPNKVAIRGLPTGSHKNVRRRIHGDGAAFTADPDGHHWMFIDFDEIRLPMFLEPDDDVELLLGFLVRLLPETFHTASYYWQWSCGQGLDGGKTLRAHLFFWSAEKHTDRQYGEWAEWVNGNAGYKVIDECVFRTVQPNYTAAPILEKGVIDPVIGQRNGFHVGEKIDVSIEIRPQTWEQHWREQERAEYEELVEYGLRKPWSELPKTSSKDRYIDYLDRIGDDKDGFYKPMTSAIWHWARAYTDDQDEAFKTLLRSVMRAAPCTKQRDLERYLSDYNLDSSLKGAREKQPPPQNALEAYRSRLKYGLSHSRKE